MTGDIPIHFPPAYNVELSEPRYGKELANRAERLATTLIYILPDPKSHQETFKNISFLIQIANSNVLTEHEEQNLSSKLEDIEEKCSINETNGVVQNLVDNVIHSNPKIKVLSYINDLEHIFCFDHNKNESDFDPIHSKFGLHLQKNLRDIDITSLERQLHSLKNELEEQPNNFDNIFNNLQTMANNL